MGDTDDADEDSDSEAFGPMPPPAVPSIVQDTIKKLVVVRNHFNQSIYYSQHPHFNRDKKANQDSDDDSDDDDDEDDSDEGDKDDSDESLQKR